MIRPPILGLAGTKPDWIEEARSYYTYEGAQWKIYRDHGGRMALEQRYPSESTVRALIIRLSAERSALSVRLPAVEYSAER
jgi:hypothetical protein